MADAGVLGVPHNRAICEAAVTLARSGDAEAIVAVTREGKTARVLSALRPAVRGWFLETTNLHVTLSEVHERMARAFDASGMRDSAAVHRNWL